MRERLIPGYSLLFSAVLLVTGVSGLVANPTTQPATQQDAMPALTPNPDRTPQEVVKIQLDALQHNDKPAPDSGLAVTFQFASPQNRQTTGPLEKFIQMVKGPEYGLLVNHKSAEYGQSHTDGSQAQQLVRITAASGEVALYVFVLRKQADGQYKDCWMTDGVMRLRPENIVPAPPPRRGATMVMGMTRSDNPVRGR